jgi:acyl-CoA reductase-like NAD-dependent aldehyde dehydrogenase
LTAASTGTPSKSEEPRAPTTALLTPPVVGCLVSYAYTRDLDRAHRLIDALETGMTGINTGLVSNASAPFGGVKQSGLGREGGLEGIYEYLDTKYTLIPR